VRVCVEGCADVLEALRFGVCEAANITGQQQCIFLRACTGPLNSALRFRRMGGHVEWVGVWGFYGTKGCLDHPA